MNAVGRGDCPSEPRPELKFPRAPIARDPHKVFGFPLRRNAIGKQKMSQKSGCLSVFIAITSTLGAITECNAGLMVSLDTSAKTGVVTGSDTGTLTANVGGQSRGIIGWLSGKLTPTSGVPNPFLSTGDFLFNGVTPNFANPYVLDLQFGQGINSDALAVFSLTLDFAGQPGAVGTVAPRGGSVSFDYSSLSPARQASFEAFMASDPTLNPILGTGFQPLNATASASAVVPEPGSLLCFGVLGLSVLRRRERASTTAR